MHIDLPNEILLALLVDYRRDRTGILGGHWVVGLGWCFDIHFWFGLGIHDVCTAFAFLSLRPRSAEEDLPQGHAQPLLMSWIMCKVAWVGQQL